MGGVRRLLLLPQLCSDRHLLPLNICARMPSKKLRVFGNPVDPVFVIGLFAESLADPLRPQHCAQCLHGCVMSLLHPDLNSHNNDILRVRHHALFNACARFITVSRSDEEISRSESEMSICKCDLADERLKAIHGNGRSDGACTYTELGLCFSRVIHLALYPMWEGHKVEKIRPPQAHRSTSTPWPRAPRDALPYGIDSSVAALSVLMKLSPNPIFVGLFHALVHLFKKALVLPILTSPTLPGRFTAIAEIALGALSAPAPPRYGPAYHVFTIDVLKHVANLYVALALTFDGDETRALFSRAAEQVDEEALLRDPMSVSIEAIKFIPQFQSPAPPGTTEALASCLRDFQIAVSAWHINLVLPYDVEKYTEPVVEAARDEHALMKEPIYAAYSCFQQLNMDRCWAPGCPETFAGALRPFSVCSGCKRVTYCSKECLTRAWKHPNVPHRAVCKVIDYIVRLTKVDPKPKASGRHAFASLCVMLSVDRTALQVFGAHMAELRQYMSLVRPDGAAVSGGPERPTEPATQTGCPAAAEQESA